MPQGPKDPAHHQIPTGLGSWPYPVPGFVRTASIKSFGPDLIAGARHIYQLMVIISIATELPVLIIITFAGKKTSHTKQAGIRKHKYSVAHFDLQGKSFRFLRINSCSILPLSLQSSLPLFCVPGKSTIMEKPGIIGLNISKVNLERTNKVQHAAFQLFII
jgi:hypothetical protein